MLYRILAVLMICCFTTGAIADTQKVNNTSYGVAVEMNQEIKLGNGMTVMTGGLSTATAVDADGSVTNQWCRNSIAIADGKPVAGGGFCAVINQEGDMLWVWFGNNKWGVISGTGGWAGATGGGTTEQVSQSLDGRSFVTKSKGTIKTP